MANLLQEGQVLGRAGSNYPPREPMTYPVTPSEQPPRKGHNNSKKQEAALSAARQGEQLAGSGLKASTADLLIFSTKVGKSEP